MFLIGGMALAQSNANSNTDNYVVDNRLPPLQQPTQPLDPGQYSPNQNVQGPYAPGQDQSQVAAQTRQITTPGLGGGQRVNNQVNTELYGNHTTQAPLYGPQIQPLPSETRMAIQRSGALPSEILINSQAVGPLSPHGAMDYIPDQSPVQKAMGAKPINLWGPAYGPGPQQNQSGLAAPTMQTGTSSGAANGGAAQNSVDAFGRKLNSPGAIQPQSPYFVDHYVQPQSLSSGYQVRPLNAYRSGIPETTTTTIIVRREMATTRPTTRSLGDDH
jgi:hypothetical protein